MAFFGYSDVELQYGGFSVSQLILRQNTRVKLKVSGNARLFVNVLDKVEAEIECTDNAKVSVFQYGGKVTYNGNVAIIKSELK